MDNRLSSKTWLWLRRHRKTWLWLKKHWSSCTRTFWSTDVNDFWEYGRDYDLDKFEELFDFIHWLTSYRVLCALLLVSVFEEIVFRGATIYFISLSNKNLFLAVVYSSVIFAFIHVRFGIHVLPSKFLVGVICALVRIASGTLFVAIVAHCLFGNYGETFIARFISDVL